MLNIFIFVGLSLAAGLVLWATLIDVYEKAYTRGMRDACTWRPRAARGGGF